MKNEMESYQTHICFWLSYVVFVFRAWKTVGNDCHVKLFQALDAKTTWLNQKQISVLALHLIFHRF